MTHLVSALARLLPCSSDAKKTCEAACSSSHSSMSKRPTPQRHGYTQEEMMASTETLVSVSF